jgi:CzcA family heavy metal efflux pump
VETTVAGGLFPLRLARFALQNEKVIVFVVAVLAVLGVRAYLTTAQSVFPTMSFSRIDVVADVGQLPADQVRSAVTLPLEQAFQALPSATTVRSTSGQGSSELVVDFSSHSDPQVDLQYVNQAIAQVRGTIPAAQNIVAVIINPSSEPVLAYALTSDQLSQATLRDLAVYQIAPKLYGATGLGRILVTGGPTREFHVDLNPSSLAANGIGASDVAKALSDQNTIQAVGLGQRYYQRYAILVDASLHDPASLGRVSVPVKGGAAIPLSALGTVRLGVSPAADQTSYNGHHAVIVNGFALPGADVVALGNDLKARLEKIVPTLPSVVKFAPYWDQTTFIVESQRALRDSILIGALLAIIVIYAFLRNARLTLVAAAVIPLAMAIAIFALQQAGQTLNLMSVGGLAVAVGLIIDDAIVVIENIARTIREHPNLAPRAAIERAMAQISTAMIASTTTTVVVFVPLALLTGVTGFFFRALASTMAASLIVSLGLALFVAPIAASVLLRGHHEKEHRDVIAIVLEKYDGVLRWALSHRRTVAAGSVGVLVVTVFLLGRLPSDFLPKTDEGKFELAYRLPVGTTLEASDAAATSMEKIVTSDPAVVSVGRLTAVDTNGYSPTPQNIGLLRITLVAPSQRADYDVVSARMRARLEAAIPSAAYDFHQILEDQINGLEGSTSPIEIDIRGNDQQTLIGLAGKVTKAIADVPGLVDLNNGVTYDNPSLRIAPDTTRLAALGITTQDVGDAMAALSQGTVATSVPESSRVIPVRVRVAGADSPLDAATGLLAKGIPSALGEVSRLNTVRLASNLDAQNGQLLLRVTGNVNNVSLSGVVDGINRALVKVPMPPGYSTEIGGQAKTQAQSFSEFLSVVAIAIALVFAVMLATFRSFRLPLVVLAAIPLALIGVAVALTVTGTPFNVSSFMGLLLLVGIVVKNGILLIDVANQYRKGGASVEESLLAAGKTRLRPIVMTTLAAIGGLLPLALGIGQGAELEKPLAIAVIGGLSTATFFTLILIPVLYATFMGRKEAPAAEMVAA